MDLKNTAILLMLLLCIMGLMIGIYYTEASESTQNPNNFEESITEDSNGTITIDLVLKENNTSD